MYRNELEKRYRNNANRVVLFCGLFFGLFRVVAELLAGEFRSAFTCGVISAVVVGLFIFFKEKNIKNFSLVVSFSMYVLYIVASFAIESFKYFYDYYLLTLLVCAVYFNARNFLILVVGTQVVNLVLSIFVLPYHMVGSVWVHFSLIFSSSLLLVIAVRFAVDKSNEDNNAFT
ncbi:MAG: hypothetical protein LBB36_03965 [Fibromonadaceae bacterium]|jgi:hypothetical protein|nr:hypothetical protein [Fibromonadaceae bacterium]